MNKNIYLWHSGWDLRDTISVTPVTEDYSSSSEELGRKFLQASWLILCSREERPLCWRAHWITSISETSECLHCHGMAVSETTWVFLHQGSSLTSPHSQPDFRSGAHSCWGRHGTTKVILKPKYNIVWLSTQCIKAKRQNM